MQDDPLELQDDGTLEEIVEHLAELGFHPQDEDDGLDEILKDAPTTGVRAVRTVDRTH